MFTKLSQKPYGSTGTIAVLWATMESLSKYHTDIVQEAQPAQPNPISRKACQYDVQRMLQLFLLGNIFKVAA
jgi:hypothetical protein